MPALARLLDYDLDQMGVTVCSVAGTNFTPYVKLLSSLKIPFAVITDLDPREGGKNLGENRVLGLLPLPVICRSNARTARPAVSTSSACAATNSAPACLQSCVAEGVS